MLPAQKRACGYAGLDNGAFSELTESGLCRWIWCWDSESSSYLMSSQNLTIYNARFQAPEILFNASLASNEPYGLIETLQQVVARSDEGFRDKLRSKVILGGGNTLFPGFAERIKAELHAAGVNNTKVVAKTDRAQSAWLGAKLFYNKFKLPEFDGFR
ncbi:uncharacterized protein LOC142357333 [Convolutriloba macropyga]|uniref:uncharacterized protein LOC142357333 n=1 Tax=Convolutriloba macropyga TaxID=536237 RepID=UPI003F525F57